tara:strand:- start:36515 stop:38137 length:1623 start_codon:yes stop_codon:yes gene_type:complete
MIGRPRPLGRDAPEAGPAQWLLHQVERDPEGFYAGVAGFFAAVVLDRQSGDFRLYTDHVGSVPLNLYCGGDSWWVADSLLQLEAALPPEALRISPQAIYDYCFHHCIPSPRTIYEGVMRLPPGSELRLALDGDMQARNLFRPSYQYSNESAEVLSQRCREVIAEAVRRNAGPGTGAFLSGGLDSSTVAGLLAGVQPGAPTFSIGFQAQGYDETAYARITAGHFATRHHVHYLQPDEIVAEFAEVAACFDQPFGNSSALAAYVCASQARHHGVATLLAGDGGDEIFAGNERYAKQKVFELWGKVPGGMQQGLSAMLAGPLGGLPLLRKGRSYVEQAAIPLPDRLDTYNYLFRFQPGEMFLPGFLAGVDTGAPRQAKRERFAACPAEDPVERMMYLDWKFTLADNDLVKVSNMCSKAGVEVRYPLFEKEVVEFSCSVPARLKLPRGRLREFYKSSFRGFLPEQTLRKSKHGFGLPFGVWMREHPALQEITGSALAGLKQREIFRPDFVDTALEHHRTGHAGYYGELIWIMVVLELWLQSRGR